MQVPNILKEKTSIIIEVIILSIFLGLMYYGYTLIGEQAPTTTTVNNGQQLFGPNLTLLLKATSEDRFVLNDVSFMDGELVRNLRDFSETITHTSVGRDNPFVPAK